MRFPVNLINVRTKFGSHKGVDLGWSKEVGEHQPIFAVADGEVIYNKYQGALSGGYVIHIKHSNGYVSEYGHLLKDSQKVKVGSKVKMGQQIASMGKSGRATGCHLHFGIYKGNYINYKDKSKFVNPLKYLCKYDDQKIYSGSKIKNLYKTKKVYNCNELNIRNKPSIEGKIVGTAKKGQQVESFGTTKGWNIVDNISGKYCSNKYVK